MDNDLISREALLKEVRENKELFETERVYLEGLLLNAPTVEYPFYAEAYQTGYEEGKNERPQGDLISRDQVLHEIGQLSLAWEYGQGVADCHAIIENALAVESRPKGEYTEEDMKRTIKENFDIGYEMAKNKYGRPQGEWKIDGCLIVCDQCGRILLKASELYNFCPQCGADMRGEKE